MKRLAAILVGAALSGCCLRTSVAPSHLKGATYAEGGGEIVEHYHVINYGWYLFNKVPIVCGDTNENAKVCFTFFRDQVRTDVMTTIFNERVRKTDTRPACVATLTDENVVFEVPGLSLALPVVVPYILCYREVQISGVLLKKEGVRAVP